MHDLRDPHQVIRERCRRGLNILTPPAGYKMSKLSFFFLNYQLPQRRLVSCGRSALLWDADLVFYVCGGSD